MLDSPKKTRKSCPDPQLPAPRPNMSAAERETFILEAMQRGVPLNRIEAWLDWVDLNQDFASSRESAAKFPAIPPSGHQDAPGTI